MRKQTSEFDLIATLLAIIMFISYLLARFGMGDEINLLPLLLAVTILLLPIVLEQFTNLSRPFLQLLILLFFIALGWISIIFSIELNGILYPTSLLTLFLFVKRLKFVGSRMSSLIWVFVFLLALKLIAIVWNTSGFLDPLTPESYSLGLFHIDTLYLSNLTALIKTYQVTTTGLFGLQPIEYHAGSNYVFASLSQLCKLNSVEFYNFAYPIIFIPLFFQAFIYASSVRLGHRKMDEARIMICLIILFFAISGFVPNGIGQQYLTMAILNTHFLSESYCVSLILFFLFISVYYPLLSKKGIFTAHSCLNTFLILLIPVWFFLIGYTKISTAVILFISFAYFVLRRRLLFQKLILIATIASSLVLPFLLSLTIEGNRSETFSIQLGSFYKYYVHGSLSVYFLLNYLWTILLLLVLYFLVGMREGRAEGRLTALTYIIPETIIMVCVAGILPGLLIEIEGGSAKYFADMQAWFSIVILVNILPYLLFICRKRINQFKVAVRLVGLILAFVVVRETIFRSYISFIKENLKIRSALMADINVPVNDERISMSKMTELIGSCRYPRTSLHFNEHVKVLKLPLLEELRSLPYPIKRSSLIYCEDLEVLPKFKDCSEAFYISAFTEIALINGAYWKDCLPSGEYSWRYYTSFQKEISKVEGFKLAKEKGFSNVIVLNLKNNNYEIVAL